MKENKKNNVRFWLLLWMLGLAGQLCWNIENQWFNTFVYAKIAKDSSIVTWMVIISALVTTISTFFFGTHSDRKGSRRIYISVGYICWGIFTIVFGFTEFIVGGSVGTTPKLIILGGVMVVLTDAIMSFFGSMGNDASFSAWTNDMTTDDNRGQIGAALAILPVIGTIIGTVVGGLLIGSNDNYQRLFWGMGLFVILMGVISLLFLKDSPNLKAHKDGSFFSQFSSIFKIGDLLKHKELLLASLATAVFFIPFNVYFVHMGNYIIHYLGFSADQMGLIQGGGLLISLVFTIPAIKMINNRKSPTVAIGAILMNFVGLWVLFFFGRPHLVNTTNPFSVDNIVMILGVILVGGGYILIIQSMTMWVKELYPEDNRGQFEGLRVVFFTLLPMIVGTIIGNIVVKNGAGSTIDASTGMPVNIPTESIYLVAAILVIFTFIPLYFASKKYKERTK